MESGVESSVFTDLEWHAVASGALSLDVGSGVSAGGVAGVSRMAGPYDCVRQVPVESFGAGSTSIAVA